MKKIGRLAKNRRFWLVLPCYFMFARTDGALYAAKENGRNCIVRDGEGKKRGVVTSIAELADKRHEANA